MNIVSTIARQAELAMTSAEAGELHSAVRILAGLTDEVRKHAALADKFLASLGYASGGDACVGHIASDQDPKVCARCGTHIDELRPPDDDLVEVRGVSLVLALDQQQADKLHRDMAADPMIRAAGDVFSPYGSGPTPIEPKEE